MVDSAGIVVVVAAALVGRIAAAAAAAVAGSIAAAAAAADGSSFVGWGSRLEQRSRWGLHRKQLVDHRNRTRKLCYPSPS